MFIFVSRTTEDELVEEETTTTSTTTTTTTTKRPRPSKPHKPKPKPKPKPTTTTTQKPKPEAEDHFKVVCYFTNWAWYRQGEGKYLPSDIDPELCTHIIYGFAVLDSDHLTIKPHDTWADFDNKFYEKVIAVKKKKANIRVLIAIGGWNDSAGDKYSRLVNSAAARQRFVTHVLQFIQEHGFDGLDLDWEYPKCWQVNCQQGPDSDKESFAAFVKELHEAFKPHGLLLI
ncbi:hypothetical protein LSTR_LSTR016561 [Laodelphax striatellus]|uniref:GH18 domain-containing protein n=1 Tax=Laodelphax striatellus TaxID=195883 RepID=A0A482XUF5_LAOST|nr:hypothetical protein LSTR_LSTR016561 [Laodelphax striatellus]